MQKVSDYFDDFPEFNPDNYDQEGNYKPKFRIRRNKMYSPEATDKKLSMEVESQLLNSEV